MNVYVVIGSGFVIGIIALLFVGFQLRDRLDKIVELLDKK